MITYYGFHIKPAPPSQTQSQPIPSPYDTTAGPFIPFNLIIHCSHLWETQISNRPGYPWTHSHPGLPLALLKFTTSPYSKELNPSGHSTSWRANCLDIYRLRILYRALLTPVKILKISHSSNGNASRTHTPKAWYPICTYQMAYRAGSALRKRRLVPDLFTKSWSFLVLAQETIYRVLSWWYLVLTRIHRSLPQYSPTCFRGCGDQGSFLCILWTCLAAQLFWQQCYKILPKLFKLSLQPDPKWSLLNFWPPHLSLAGFRLLHHVTTAVKEMIARAWKSPSLSLVEVKNWVTQTMIHEKLKAILTNKVPCYAQIWQPWVEHYLPSNFDASLSSLWLWSVTLTVGL